MNLSLCEIGAELPCAVNEISVSIFSDKIFHLSANINIASCRAYKSGKVLSIPFT